MKTVGLAIETVPGHAPLVAARLANCLDLQIHRTDGNSCITAVCRSANAADLQTRLRNLLEADCEILAIHRTLSAVEDGD